MFHKIAIAGAWGYIGRKMLDAALALGARPLVFDPGPPPSDLDLSRIERIEDEQAFYEQPADLFHLALHPQHRRRALETLLDPARPQPPLILNEKPMAPPEDAGQCDQLIQAVERSPAPLLFNFPERFHPMTEEIARFLGQFRQVKLQEVYLHRSKDREADIPRNYKRMVPIQYQESVHCLAFLLWLLEATRASLDSPLQIHARAAAYAPPNPGDYPYRVDGRCDYEMQWGATRIRGLTDFKRNAARSKQRTIRGEGDGQPFVIDVDYLEDGQRLTINGRSFPQAAGRDSYQAVLQTLARWRAASTRDELLHGPFPHPRFARLTYQLSAALWHSSHFSRPLQFEGRRQVLAFESGFAAAVPSFGKYSPGG